MDFTGNAAMLTSRLALPALPSGNGNAGNANLKMRNDTIFKSSYCKTYGLTFRKLVFDDFMAMLAMLT
jgi:hypothetical protein